MCLILHILLNFISVTSNAAKEETVSPQQPHSSPNFFLSGHSGQWSRNLHHSKFNCFPRPSL